MRKLFLAIAVVLLSVQAAWAYVGPGLGGGVIATVLGVLAAAALALFAIVWYPLKRLLKKVRQRGRK